MGSPDARPRSAVLHDRALPRPPPSSPRPARAAGGGGRGLHLSHAPAGPAGRPGRVPDLRHGAGAGRRGGRGRPQPRTGGHDPAASGSPLAFAVPVFGLEMGGHLAGPAHGRSRPGLSTGCSWCWPRRWWSGPGCRSSCAAGVAGRPQPQHVHLIALGTGVGLRSIAWSPPLAPGLFPPAFRAIGGAAPVYFEAGGGDHRAGAARPGAGAARREQHRRARSARCWTWRPRPPAALGADGGEEEVPLDAGRRSATACACARAKRCRSTAPVLEGHSTSTNRWSPANPCRWPRTRRAG